MGKPVKTEIERINAWLSGAKGTLTPKQKFALMIELQTLQWVNTLTKAVVPTPPSKIIMKKGT